MTAIEGERAPLSTQFTFGINPVTLKPSCRLAQTMQIAPGSGPQ